MEPLEVTKLSSKGQVVLPQNIRLKLGLEIGEKFVVMGENDTIILKKLHKPAFSKAKELLKKSRLWAKKSGLTPKSIEDAVRKVREEKR